MDKTKKLSTKPEEPAPLDPSKLNVVFAGRDAKHSKANLVTPGVIKTSTGSQENAYYDSKGLDVSEKHVSRASARLMKQKMQVKKNRAFKTQPVRRVRAKPTK